MTRWERLDDIDRLRAEDVSYWQECAAFAHSEACKAFSKGNKWLCCQWQKRVAYYHSLAWKNLERLIP